MTFPCKEDLIFIENMAKQQHRIFDDSCDMGVHVAEIKEVIDYDIFKQHIKNIIDFYGVKKENYYETVIANIAIPVEQDGAYFDCIVLEIIYCTQIKPHPSQMSKFHDRNNSFLSFNIDREMLTKADLKINYNSKLFDEKTNTYNSDVKVVFDEERTKKPELKDFNNCKSST